MKRGQWVRIHCDRPLLNRYDGQIGIFLAAIYKSNYYVKVGSYCPNFFPEELEPIEPPTLNTAREVANAAN